MWCSNLQWVDISCGLAAPPLNLVMCIRVKKGLKDEVTLDKIRGGKARGAEGARGKEGYTLNERGHEGWLVSG